jgi:formylglycine-generating enzyme
MSSGKQRLMADTWNRNLVCLAALGCVLASCSYSFDLEKKCAALDAKGEKLPSECSNVAWKSAGSSAGSAGQESAGGSGTGTGGTHGSASGGTSDNTGTGGRGTSEPGGTSNESTGGGSSEKTGGSSNEPTGGSGNAQTGTGGSRETGGTSSEGTGGDEGSDGSPPSCKGLPHECGFSEDCCTTIKVPGGTFMMGPGAAGESDYATDEVLTADPPHEVTVSSFYLDKYEVTVGRFRHYLDAVEAGWRPSIDDGANAAVKAQHPDWDTGWRSTWTLPTSYVNVDCNYSLSNSLWPVNCVNWYGAFGFCVWDGGRLPTEAEWEYAAAGGSKERFYPWGVAEPDATRVSDTTSAAVGTKPSGAGFWGHLGLADSVREWCFDWFSEAWYADPLATGRDPANVLQADSRVQRGGYGRTNVFASVYRAAARGSQAPDTAWFEDGIRCARDVPASEREPDSGNGGAGGTGPEAAGAAEAGESGSAGTPAI